MRRKKNLRRIEKRWAFIILIIGMVLILGSILLLIKREEGSWICQNGQWVKHGNTHKPQPTESCEDGTQVSKENEEIVVFSPQPNEIVNSPIKIKGKAKGTWFFEAIFPVRLLDNKDKELAKGFVEAEGDWMTEDFVSFKGEIRFEAANATSGVLVFEKNNPSGLPEKNKEFRLPVQFKSE